MERRSGWLAVWGVVAAAFIGAAVAWFIAAAPTDSHLTVWPALGLALAGLVGTYCLFATQWSIWPFGRAPDRDVARSVFDYFEDRRVLYQAHEQLTEHFSTPIDPEERPDWCTDSAINIRDFVTARLDELRRGGRRSDIAGHLGRIRAACREFVTEMADAAATEDAQWQPRIWDTRFLLALARMRAEVGAQIAQIAEITKVEIPEVLKPILPPQVHDSDDAELPRLYTDYPLNKNV